MDWKKWCRLCGNQGLIKTDNGLEESIYEVLQLKISELTICHDCTNFLYDLSAFKTRATAIQDMFNELDQHRGENQLSLEELNLVRVHFGLSPCDEFTEFPEDHLEEGANEADTNPMDIQQEDKEESALEYDEEDALLTEDCEATLDDKLESPSSKRKNCRKKNLQKTESEKLYEFKCHVCDLEFVKMQLLSSHCRTAHQTNPKVLCWCGAVLSTWKRLMAHKSKHIKEDDEFSCKDCKVSYKTKSAFEKHNLLRHGPNAVRFMCAICGKEFKERQILRNHEKIHLPDELKLKHPCSYCAKKFVNSHCLKIHVARVHEKVALHTCELCGKGCITKSDLKWHMDKHVEERKFECDICSLKFKSTNSLRIHKRRHFNQDKAIICQVCGKEFFSSAALSNHKLVHSDVKRYKCFCGNEYKRLESYKCHLNSTHTGERPFSCMWCNRTFVNSANCRKHKLKDHPIEVHEYEAIHGKKGVSLAMKTTLKA